MVCQSLQQEEGTRFIMFASQRTGQYRKRYPKVPRTNCQGRADHRDPPDITRYFMSIPEAAQLVLQAGLMGKGGEIFVLDMGEPVKIVDLAKDLIRLSGMSEEEIRMNSPPAPGEKLYEELLADSEHTCPPPSKTAYCAST